MHPFTTFNRSIIPNFDGIEFSIVCTHTRSHVYYYVYGVKDDRTVTACFHPSKGEDWKVARDSIVKSSHLFDRPNMALIECRA